jgi:hypothetical protein
MRLRLIPVVALVVFVPACGEKAPESPPPADVEAGLKELSDVYKYRCDQRMPGPAKAADLTEHEGALPNAWPAIQDGTIVVAWRAGYAANATGILAHAKDAPASGGKVLLRNGTVKDMTAEEFRAAKGK